MQRILSAETSRFSSQTNSEFVTKRFCCSFLLTVAFFAILGGFLLGKFVSDKTLDQISKEMTEISKKIAMLNQNLQNTFHNGLSNGTLDNQYPFLSCHFMDIGNSSEGLRTSVYLKQLNECFNNG